MPPRPEHIRQADHNEGVFRRLDSLDIIDWTITVMFYAALHKVDAYLALQNIHPTKHYGKNPPGRNQYVKEKLPRDEARNYLRLYNASKRSRYEVGCLEPNTRAYYEGLFQNHFIPLNDYFQSV